MIVVKHNYIPCIIRLTRCKNKTSSSENSAPNNPEEPISSNEDGNPDESDSLPNGTLKDHNLFWFNKVALVLNSAILVDYFGSDVL